MHCYVVHASQYLRQRFCVVVVDNVVGGGLEVTRGIVFVGWFFWSGSKISFQVINSHTRQLRKLVRTIHYFFFLMANDIDVNVLNMTFIITLNTLRKSM
jgi:hypothetical protein